MTFPPGALIGLSGAPRPGLRRVSWILLLGFIPVERMAFVLDEVADRRTVETARGAVQRLGRHERRVVPTGENTCALRDIVTTEPRVAWARPATMKVVASVFHHRHKRLIRLYS